MNTAGKLAAFAAVVAVGFGAAAAVGSAVGPIDVSSESVTHDTHGGADKVEPADLPRGLAIAGGGYRLALDWVSRRVLPDGAVGEHPPAAG